MIIDRVIFVIRMYMLNICVDRPVASDCTRGKKVGEASGYRLREDSIWQG
jgi:hypothetical protein